MHIPEYASIALATAGMSPVGGERCYVADRLMFYRPGADFEFPGRSDGASGLWVPEQFRDALIRVAMWGGVAWNANPNLAWAIAQTTSGVGAVTLPAADETQFASAVNADVAYWYKTGLTISATKTAIYLKCQIVSGSDSGTHNVPYWADGSKGRIVRGSNGGVAGDIDYSVVTRDTGPFSMGAGVIELWCESIGTDTCSAVWDHNLQRRVLAGENAGFSANANKNVYVGKLGTTGNGTCRIKGTPALIYFERLQ